MSTADLKPRKDEKLKRPGQYVVKFVNDDFTPMDFVIAIMVEVFGMGHDEATAKTMEIHHKGSSVHGPYTFEVAETLCARAMHVARMQEFPFRCAPERG